MSKHAPVVRRTRRSDTSTPIMGVRFPETYTDEQINGRLKDFGLSNFTVSRSDKEVVARRSDLKLISSDTTREIRLTSDGVIAIVSRGDDTAAENPKSSLAVTSIVFRSDTHTPETVAAWLASNGYEAPTIDAGDGDYIVQRAEVPEGEETRTIDLGDGVSVSVVRSDVQVLPTAYVTVINETAYGNWGWGHLSFAQATADREFCDEMDDATYSLRNVLYNILVYSALPLADRKALVAQSLQQFGDYVTGFIDSLPQQVMVAVARSSNTKDQNMSKQGASDSAPAANTPAASTPAASDTITITRAELASVVSEAVTSALAAQKPADTSAQRSEPGATEGEKPADGEKPAEPTAASQTPAEATITRADLNTAVASAVAPLAEAITKLAGTTVVRSDMPDGEQTRVTPTGGEAKDKDVFRGAPAFSGLRNGIKNGHA